MDNLFPKYHHVRDTYSNYNVQLDTAIKVSLDVLNQIGVHESWGTTGAVDANAFTICILQNSRGGEVSRGYSFCGPEEQFCKAKGRKIAYGRALSSVPTGVHSRNGLTQDRIDELNMGTKFSQLTQYEKLSR